MISDFPATMRSTISALLLLAAVDALQLSPRGFQRCAKPRMQFPELPKFDLPDFEFPELPNPFGEKKPPPKYDNPPPKDDPTLRDQSTWTAEDKKIVNDMASNWASERKPNQEGYTFFQSPSPKTGDQGLDDFKIQPQALEIGWQVKVFGGISAVLLFALLVTLIVS